MNKVLIDRELLEEIVELHARRGVVLTIHIESLAEVLAQPAADCGLESGLEDWAKGKFRVDGRFCGQLDGNTDWALTRKVWSAALGYAEARDAMRLEMLDTYGEMIKEFESTAAKQDARIAELEAQLNDRIQNVCQLQVELDALKSSTVSPHWKETVEKLGAELDALKAQKPVAWISWTNEDPEWKLKMLVEPAHPPVVPLKLYAAPAKQEDKPNG